MKQKLKIRHSFSQASTTYHDHAFVQGIAAEALATRILSENKGPLGNVLEIGAGTGLLTSLLSENSTRYIMTDVSLPLLQQGYNKIDDNSVFPLVVDADQLCFSASFDFIISNLTLHWLENPKAALTNLTACLKPGGKVYLTALGNNTFHEWRAAHSVVGAPNGVFDFISIGQLKDWLPLSGTRHVEEQWMNVSHPSALDFLRSLKKIGGHVSHSTHTPLPPITFKRVMEVFDENPCVTYQLLYATYEKPGKLREE